VRDATSIMPISAGIEEVPFPGELDEPLYPVENTTAVTGNIVIEASGGGPVRATTVGTYPEHCSLVLEVDFWGLCLRSTHLLRVDRLLLGLAQLFADLRRDFV